MNYFLLIPCLLCNNAAVSASGCQALDCLTQTDFPLFQQLLSSQMFDHSFFTSFFSEEGGQGLCRRLPTLKACIEEELVSCGRQRQSLLRGALKTLSKLCSIEPKYYEEMSQCVEPGPAPFKDCTEAYETNTHRAVKQYSAQQLQQVFCSLTEEYLNCFYRKVKAKCGHSVAATHRAVMVQMFRPTFSPYGCAITEEVTAADTSTSAAPTTSIYIPEIQEVQEEDNKDTGIMKLVLVTVGVIGLFGAVTAAIFIIWHVTCKRSTRYAEVLQKNPQT